MLKRILGFVALFSALAGAQTVQPYVSAHPTFLNQYGAGCGGCKLYSYAAGTTTPQATYTDSSGSVANTNPIVLGTDGGASIWLSNLTYKFALYDTAGNVIWTVDNVQGLGQLVALSGTNTWTGKQTFSNGAAYSGGMTGDTLTLSGAETAPIIDQIVYSAGGYATLNAAAAACPLGGGCTVVVSNNTSLNANLTLTANTKLEVKAPAQITTTGYTLTVPNVDAGPYQIFAGSGTVSGLTNAKPEWWGSAHLNNAVNALASGGNLLLQNANYISDYTVSNLPKALNIIGTARPAINNTHTQLVAGTGTIITGEFNSNQSQTKIYSLGFDCGPVAQVSGSDCVNIQNAAGSTLSDVVVQDVAILGYSSSDAHHAFYSANVKGILFSHVISFNEFHGVVFYDTDVTVHDLTAYSSGEECLYIGSDTTAANGQGGNINIDGVNCQSFTAGDLGGGIVLTAKGATLQNVNLTDIHILGNTNSAVALNTSGAVNTVLGVNMDNFILDGQGAAGGGITPANQIGINIQNVGGANMGELHFAHGIINNQYFGPIFMGQDSTWTSFSDIAGENFNGPAQIRGASAVLQNINFSNISTGTYCYNVVAGVVYYWNLICTSGPATLVGGAGTASPFIPPYFRFGLGSESISANGSAFAFNRNVQAGGAFNTSGFSYQWLHTANSTAASDTLALQVRNGADAAVNLNTIKVDGTGAVFIGGGTNIVYRCATAGTTLPVGSLTINAAACGTTTDTGLRVN